MKKIVSLVALAGMFMLMSFGQGSDMDCKAYANQEVVTALAYGVTNPFSLGVVYGWAIADCEEANEQGAELISVWL